MDASKFGWRRYFEGGARISVEWISWPRCLPVTRVENSSGPPASSSPRLLSPLSKLLSIVETVFKESQPVSFRADQPNLCCTICCSMGAYRNHHRRHWVDRKHKLENRFVSKIFPLFPIGRSSRHICPKPFFYSRPLFFFFFRLTTFQNILFFNVSSFRLEILLLRYRLPRRTTIFCFGTKYNKTKNKHVIFKIASIAIAVSNLRKCQQYERMREEGWSDRLNSTFKPPRSSLHAVLNYRHIVGTSVGPRCNEGSCRDGL